MSNLISLPETPAIRRLKEQTLKERLQKLADQCKDLSPKGRAEIVPLLIGMAEQWGQADEEQLRRISLVATDILETAVNLAEEREKERAHK